MQVLLLSQWYPPEPQKIVSDIAVQLQKEGHEVTVLTGYPNFPTGRIYPGYRMRLWMREELDRISVVRVPLYPDHSRSVFRRTLNLMSFALFATILGPWLVKRPDTIYCIQPLTSMLPAIVLSRFGRVPVVYEVQDLWPETLEAAGFIKNGLILGFVGWVMKRVYCFVDAVRVISPGFRENLISKGVPEEKIRVISNWVDTEAFEPRDADRSLAEELGTAGKFTVMFAGTMGAAQNLENVLKAAELLRDAPDIQFVLLGGGSAAESLQEEAQRRELDNVRFCGRFSQEEMPRINALADVLLVHLRDDPLFRITIPHKIFCSMASGRPILAAVSGDAADVVRDSGGGLVCQPGQPEALAQAVRSLFAMSADDRNRMGRNGRKSAVQWYSRPTCVAQIERMLCEVADARARRRRRPSSDAADSARPAPQLFCTLDWQSKESVKELAGGLPEELEVSLWRPTVSRMWPRGLSWKPFGVWWLFHILRIFTNRDYSVLLIRDGDRVVHRSCVFPRYFRFPFMERNDLQIGDTWTDPDYRGRGIATIGLIEAIRQTATPGRRYWYLVAAENVASVRVAEKVGFHNSGSGRRVSRFGLRLFGTFEMDSALRASCLRHCEQREFRQ